MWQDRRTEPICARLRARGAEATIHAKTGLVIDPYFSGTKLQWILDHVPGARTAAARGELAFGTVDSWLLWQLTGGAVHATDVTNASRTLLFDVHTNRWDDELLALLDVPRELLPEVHPSCHRYGQTLPALLGAALPIAWCRHGAGPPVCWCRKPLPSLGVELAHRHGVDLARAVHVGAGAADRGFAERLGLRYVDAATWWRDPAPPPPG